MFLSLGFAFHTEIGIRGCYQVPEFPESGYGQNISRHLKRKICQGEMRSEITGVTEQANGTKEMVNGHHVLGGRGVVPGGCGGSLLGSAHSGVWGRLGQHPGWF